MPCPHGHMKRSAIQLSRKKEISHFNYVFEKEIYEKKEKKMLCSRVILSTIFSCHKMVQHTQILGEGVLTLVWTHLVSGHELASAVKEQL